MKNGEKVLAKGKTYLRVVDPRVIKSGRLMGGASPPGRRAETPPLSGISGESRRQSRATGGGGAYNS